MIRKIIYFILVVVAFVPNQSASAQEMMHLQSVVKQEYINPAYNSFKDYMSLNVISRIQWVSLPYHPEVYGANIYIPFRVSRLGLNVTMVRENIGLRKITSLDASMSSNVKVSKAGFLAFGYGIGVKNTTYRTDEIVSYDDSYLFDHEIWTTQKLTVKLGLLYADTHIFSGFSANMLIDRAWDQRYVLWPSFDFIAGAMYKIHRNIVFRPDVVIKYYKAETSDMIDGEVSKSYLPPVFDPGINFLFNDKVWVGTSYRVDMSQTFSVTVEVNKHLKIGYTYEYGIGEGVNQFSSHGVNISYKFNQKAVLYDAQKNIGLRHNIAGTINRNHLYH